MKAKAQADYEEEQRYIKKLEGRFLNLLEESFYLSDHVGMAWDDAKKILQKRSAYDSVGKSDRKRLFYKHMENLAAKMESKAKSMKLLMDSRDQQQSQSQSQMVAPSQTIAASLDVSKGIEGKDDAPPEGGQDKDEEDDNEGDSEDGDAGEGKERGDRDKERDHKERDGKEREKDKDKDKHSKKHKKEKKHKKVVRS